jgi:hypothetical protein
MEEIEYKDNEKVLFKAKGKLSLPHKKPEHVDCFVTEGHVVIEAEEPIKIPASRIKDCQVNIDSLGLSSISHPGSLSGTVRLWYLDDENKKHELSLEMAASELGYFKCAAEEAYETATVTMPDS